jgi:hypothetical protein
MTKTAYGLSPVSGSAAPGNSTRSKERRFQLLLSELDCAEAMAGLANIAIDFENFRRTYNNARQYYEHIVSQLLQVHVPGEYVPEILRRLDHLRKWLDAASGRQRVEM